MSKKSPLLATSMSSKEKRKARVNEIIQPLGLSLKQVEELKYKDLTARIACLNEDEKKMVLIERRKMFNKASVVRCAYRR